jgi:hypothetical protein
MRKMFDYEKLLMVVLLFFFHLKVSASFLVLVLKTVWMHECVKESRNNIFLLHTTTSTLAIGVTQGQSPTNF